MATTSGFFSWSWRPGKGNARLAGEVIEFQAEVGRSRPLGVARISTNAGTVIHQARFAGADLPLLIEPEAVPLKIQFRNQIDFLAFQRATAGNHAVQLFLRGYMLQCDAYSLALLAAEGITSVRTSRPVAYNNSTITQDPVTGYPPIVDIDGEDVSDDYDVPTTASGNAWDVVDVTGATGTQITICYVKAPRVLFEISETWAAACEITGTAYDDPQCVSGL